MRRQSLDKSRTDFDPGAKISEIEEDAFPETRQEFRSHYTYLLKEGLMPDQTTGAIRPEGYPDVEIMPNGDVFGDYQKLKEYLNNEELSGGRNPETARLEAHHLLEARLMVPFGFDASEGECVAVYSDEHMELIHGKYGVDFQLPKCDDDWSQRVVYHIWDVVDGSMQAYNDIGRPEWGEKVLDFVRQNRDRILDAYGDGTLSGATEKEIKKAKEYLSSL